MNSGCLAHYNHNATNTTPSCLTWWGSVSNSSDFSTTFGWKLVSLYFYPSPQQAWFCIYLFVYSQIMAFNFSNWHPKHGDDGPDHPTCCGKEYGGICGILKKPFSIMARVLCCMCICFLPARNPGEFTKTITKLLMGPIKLACVPSLILALVELLLRWHFPDGKFHAFSFLFDWCNNIHFLTIFFLGYAIMSGDSLGFGNLLKKCRWWYLIIGSFFLSAYTAAALFGDIWLASLLPEISNYVLKCVLRGFGEWMFMIGLYAVNRSICTRNFKIIKILREMAMPFYLLHQQVLIGLISGTLWVPYVGSFPATIVLSTLLTCLVSYSVVKSPGPIRYFFGLHSVHRIIPGEKLSGMGPLLMLCVIVILETAIAWLIVYFHTF